MEILGSQLKINGLKPKPNKRPTNPRFELRKDQPLGPYNFPVYSFAKYRVYGYKEDAAGIRRYYNWEETLPCGQNVRLTHDDPDMKIYRCERAVGGPRLL